MKTNIIAALALMLTAGPTTAWAQNVHINPTNGAFSRAVKVPAGSETLYVSGIVPQPVVPASEGKPAEYGDTRTQTANVLAQIGDILKGEGYDWEDVVMMRILLVGDPALGGRMDFAGMSAAYNEIYGSLTNRPARITSQAAGLALPGFLSEIEVQAARRPR